MVTQKKKGTQKTVKLDPKVLLERFSTVCREFNRVNPLLNESHSIYGKIMYDKTENVENREKVVKDETIRLLAKNDQYGFTIYLLLLQNKLKEFPILKNYYSLDERTSVSNIVEKSIDRDKIKEIIKILTPNQEKYLEEILKEKYFGDLLSRSYEGFKKYMLNPTEKTNEIFQFAEWGLLTKSFDITQKLTDDEKKFFNKDFVNIANLLDIILLYKQDIWQEYEEVNPNKVDTNPQINLPEEKFNNRLNALCEMLKGKTELTWTKYIIPLADKVNNPDISKYVRQIIKDLRTNPEKLALWTDEQLKKYEEKHNVSLLSKEDITNDLISILSDDYNLG